MFSFLLSWRRHLFLKAGTSSSSSATLHVWEPNHFLSSPFRCLLGPRECLNPFCGHRRTGCRDWYVKRHASMSAPPSDLDCDLSGKLQLTEAVRRSAEPAVKECPLLSVYLQTCIYRPDCNEEGQTIISEYSNSTVQI